MTPLPGALAPAQVPPPGAQRQLAHPSQHWRKHERTILVIQGGGALGAYQAGVYAGLVESGLAVDWVTGVSIGAINAALIAGNPAERRVGRLREFWDRIAQPAPFGLAAGFSGLRPLINRAHASTAALFGVPGLRASRASISAGCKSLRKCAPRSAA